MLKRRLVPSLLATTLLIVASIAIPSQAREDEIVRLSLDECLRMALANNLDLVSARKDPMIAELQVDQSRAVFDAGVTAEGSFNRLNSDLVITDKLPGGGGTTDGFNDRDLASGKFTWSQLLNFGGTYDVSIQYVDEDKGSQQISTGFFRDSVSTFSSPSTTLGFQLPLLRGFGKENNQIDVLLARSGVDISNEDFRLLAMQTMKATEDGYWDLVASRAAYGVSKESLKLARDLYELNKKKVEVGTLAPIDVTQAEAGVASREEDVIVAEATVQNAEDNLRRFLAVPPDDPTWSATLEPVDQPVFEEQSVDVAAAIAIALERRPEIINSGRFLRDSELSERVAKNGARHSLTFDANYVQRKSDFDDRTLTTIIVDPMLPPVMTLVDTNTDAKGPDWRVGLTYGFTVGNRQAKAAYAIATINREKSELDVRRVEQDIRVDVRAAARAVTSGAKRVAAARSSAVLQRRTLEAEQKKYENGMSTSFEVLRIQTDLSDAQLSEIRAILDYTKALADLERAKGTLLEARGLALGP